MCRLKGDPQIQKFVSTGPFEKKDINGVMVLVESDVENCEFRVECMVQKKGITDLPKWLTVAMGGQLVNFTNSHQISVSETKSVLFFISVFVNP